MEMKEYVDLSARSSSSVSNHLKIKLLADSELIRISFQRMQQSMAFTRRLMLYVKVRFFAKELANA